MEAEELERLTEEKRKMREERKKRLASSQTKVGAEVYHLQKSQY